MQLLVPLDHAMKPIEVPGWPDEVPAQRRHRDTTSRGGEPVGSVEVGRRGMRTTSGSVWLPAPSFHGQGQQDKTRDREVVQRQQPALVYQRPEPAGHVFFGNALDQKKD